MDFDKYKSEYIRKDHAGNQKRSNDAIGLFKKDLGEEFGVKGRMLDIIFDYAWREGHHSGFSEVYSYFAELDQFAIDIIAEAKANAPTSIDWNK